MTYSIDEILSPSFPGYEPRPEQSQMAASVREALAGGQRLLVEAGTGTGKSFAYLIPLIEYARDNEARAVVSTYTKALQRQLVEKDLPFLRDGVFKGLRFSLCLGSDNYLCLRRLAQAREYGLFTEGADEIDLLDEWAAETGTGVREDQPWGIWSKVSRESDLCVGRDCRHFEGCFYQKARAEQKRSHILVVNHHLYFANLAAGLRVLPFFGAAVFDEAHELEDVAAGYLGLEVSNLGLAYIFNAILSSKGRGLLSRLKWLSPSDFAHTAAILNTARLKAVEFFNEVEERLKPGTVRIRAAGFAEDTVSEHLTRLARELDGLQGASGYEEEKKEIGAMASRCRGAASAVTAVLGLELEGHVYWAEKSGRLTKLAATPVEVSALEVFEPLDSAVFTSATLSTGGNFNYIKERLGLLGAQELLLKSHFNYQKQALLYIASDLPAPRPGGDDTKLIEKIRDILLITGGRTLVLFTSHSMLRKAAEGISIDGLDIVRQGDAESYRIIEEFRNGGHPTAVFGTYTFWQGIDVPGEALECVVITKLPFAVPDEPIVEARMEALEKKGRDPFNHYQIPRAAILLKQGFGRLIRRKTDRGVVAILDPRVVTRGYGRYFLNSLPRARTSNRLDDVRGFLTGSAPGLEPPPEGLNDETSVEEF